MDCLLYGIDNRSLRLGAKATKCEEPEQVLKYFQSIKQQPRESDIRPKINYGKKTTGNSYKPISNTRPMKLNDSTKNITCYNCNETGHYSFSCNKKILKCNNCNRLGYLTTNCSKLPNNDSSLSDSNK